MMLLTWGYNEEKEAAIPRVGKRAWRWVLEVTSNWTYSSIEIRQEVNFLEESNIWDERGLPYYGIWIDKSFRLGDNHVWYDGPHCGFDIGWLHFNWSNISGDCNKCNPLK